MDKGTVSFGLVHLIHMSKNYVSERTRAELFAAASYQCYYCNQKCVDRPGFGNSICLNSYVPYHVAKRRWKENYVPACFDCCNLKKDMNPPGVGPMLIRKIINVMRKDRGYTYFRQWIDACADPIPEGYPGHGVAVAPDPATAEQINVTLMNAAEPPKPYKRLYDFDPNQHPMDRRAEEEVKKASAVVAYEQRLAEEAAERERILRERYPGTKHDEFGHLVEPDADRTHPKDEDWGEIPS